MTEMEDQTIKITIVSTMFDHGGVVTYWRDVINALGETAQWRFFVNTVESVDPDPFKRSNVTIIKEFIWDKPLHSSLKLIQEVQSTEPRTLIFNGTLAAARLLPAIIYFRLFCRSLKIKCVFHNAAIYGSVWKDTLNRTLVSLVGALCHEAVFVSAFVAHYWWCKGAVISRPYQPKAKLRYLPKKSYNIGFLGRISHEKDPELFLNVMDCVRKKITVNAEIAGHGPLKAELEERYPWAVWRGWVQPSVWLKEMDLLVTTSKTEGWPLAIGEAIEAGVPVIGINVGGVGEILKDVASYLTMNRDVQELCKRVTGFLIQYEGAAEDYFKKMQGAQITLKDWGMSVTT